MVYVDTKDASLPKVCLKVVKHVMWTAFNQKILVGLHCSKIVPPLLYTEVSKTVVSCTHNMFEVLYKHIGFYCSIRAKTSRQFFILFIFYDVLNSRLLYVLRVCQKLDGSNRILDGSFQEL